jgi:hypothetical protein
LISPNNLNLGTPDSKNRSEIAKTKELELVNAVESSYEESEEAISANPAQKDVAPKEPEGTNLEV